MSKKSKEKFDIYECVTSKILDALDHDIMPWRKPWSVKNGTTRHTNFHSKRPYRGINPFLLEITAVVNGWSSPYWLTGKQVKEHGGKVNEDQYFSNDGPGSTLVVFWNRSEFKPKAGYRCVKCEGKYNAALVCNKCGEKAPAKMKSVLLRYYNVWNIEQTDITPPAVETEEVKPFDSIAEADRILSEMPDAPKVRYGGGRACYIPALDAIQLPNRIDFHSSEAFYSTSFHEHVHATGSENRVNRKGAFGNEFGSPEYAKEELVAEMGASMLCAIAGVENELDQSASYIRHWMSKADYEEALKADKKLVVIAAAQAQKAADFITGEYKQNGE